MIIFRMIRERFWDGDVPRPGWLDYVHDSHPNPACHWFPGWGRYEGGIQDRAGDRRDRAVHDSDGGYRPEHHHPADHTTDQVGNLPDEQGASDSGISSLVVDDFHRRSRRRFFQGMKR